MYRSFPQVSEEGMTYLFLWFCPTDSHCFGFHIILGNESGKDPAAAVYTHSEKSPECIFYDHAFGLSKYVNNCESWFFKITWVFLEVLLGLSHKCSTSLS